MNMKYVFKMTKTAFCPVTRAITRTTAIRTIGAACLAILAVNTSALQSSSTHVDSAALSSAKSTFFDEFSLADKANLANYTKVYIEQPTVSFDKRWLKDNRIKATERYKERTKKRYAEILHKQLSKAFSRDDHYTIVDTLDGHDNVLVVAPLITKLDIHGPDFNNNVQNFVLRAGDAELEVELRDKQGNTLAKIKDHRETFDRGLNRVVRTNRVLNQREFRRLMKRWSHQTVKHVASN